MKVKGYFETDCGKIREANEDAGGIFYNQTGQLLAIVADGMGGHQAGEVASELAVKFTSGEWEKTDQLNETGQAEQWLQQMIEKMNQYIYEYSLENATLKGMGTTVVITICLPNFTTIGHVGDSRCYLWSNEVGIKQITSDHSLVNELIRSGEITASDAEQHPRKNVLLQAVGTEELVHPDIQTVEWKTGDCLLLCSDGLSNKVEEHELAESIASMADTKTAVQELITRANERGGEDNITIAIVCNDATEKVGDEPC